jgi:TonB-linked SusC/RagA family outer membrane protein
MYKIYTKIPCVPPGYIHKLLMIMKLTTVIIIATLLQVSASTTAQKITYKKNGATLSEIFKQINLQTGYNVLYSPDLIDENSKMNVNYKNTELKKVLDQVLNSQTQQYTIDNHNILITKVKTTSFIDNIIKAINSINIHGKIVDERGSPIVGATIRLKDKSQFTSTTSDGSFYLTQVNENAIIIISSIGYLTKEVNAKADLGTIVLAVSNAKLDEVLITGYGITTQRLSTGAIGKVSGAQIEQQPVSDPILALEGRVPGLFITQTAGYPGATLNVVIRGQTTLSSATPANVAPLYVIDGIPFSSTPVEQTAGAFGGTGLNPLNTINPSDIESINVLKDADATAIYGSRGASGVIVITTKKGKAGDTKFNIDLSDGFGKASHLIPMLNTDQYLSIRRQAFANDGITPTTSNAPDLTQYGQTAYTNFPDLLIGNTAHQTNAAFSISGGDAYTQFLFGANLRHESTIYDANTDDNAEQFHLNMQHKSHDNKFGVTAAVSYNIDNNSIPNYTLSVTDYGLPPNYPLYNSNGSLFFGTGYTSPLAAFNSDYNLKSNNLISNATMYYTILPGLNIEADAGYNLDNVASTTITPISASNPLYNPEPTSNLTNNYVKTYIVEPKLTYTYTLGKGKFDLLIGGSWQETQYVQPYYIFGAYTDPQLATSLGALTVYSTLSGYTDYRYDSGYSRLEYEWNDEFLVSGNIRRDGSSRFGENKRFGTFGSGAAAWIFTKDNFIKNNLPWLSFGKIKTSYGTVGNDKATDYAYESTYNTGTAYGPYTSLTPTSIDNPELQWEVTKKLDAAIDLGFLQDRILFSIDAYRNRTSHLLAANPLPSQDGFASYTANLPAGAVVQNKGLEMELTTNNIRNKDFSWTTSINFTLPQNKLLSYPNLLNSIYANTFVVGQSLNSFYVYHFTGFQNGVATVQDVNHNGTISTGIAANGKGDYIIDGNADPKFYGGVNNTISYKGFQLDILFQGVSRKAKRGDLSFASYPGMGYNLPKSILDLPVKYSATASSPAAQAYHYYTASDAAIQDASFVRLKNVSLAYNFPSSIAKHLKMSGLQLYVHAQNLLTFTGYKGLDPETLSNTLPSIRMMIAGIKTTF